MAKTIKEKPDKKGNDAPVDFDPTYRPKVSWYISNLFSYKVRNMIDLSNGADFVLWSCGTLLPTSQQGATTPHNTVCAFRLQLLLWSA